MGSKSPSLRFGPAFLSSIHLKHHRWSINGPLRGSLQRNPHCHTVFYVFYSSNKKLASLSNIKMGTRSSMSFFKIPRRIRSATRTWLVSHWNRHNPNQPEQIAAQSEASEASEPEKSLLRCSGHRRSGSEAGCWTIGRCGFLPLPALESDRVIWWYKMWINVICLRWYDMLWCFIVAFCLSDNLVLTRKHDSVSPEHTTIRPIHGFTEVLKESPLRNSKLAEVQPIINLKEARLGVACPIKHYVWRGNCDVVWSYSFIPKWPSCLKSMLPKIPALVYTYTYIHKYTLNMYIYIIQHAAAGHFHTCIWKYFPTGHSP